MSARILIVDDHALFREGVRSLLERSGFEVAGEAGDGVEAIQRAGELSPDVVVMDVTMPNLDGIEATRGIMSNAPGTRVIALSIHGGKHFVESMLKAGAAGYILKDSVPEQLVEGVQAVLRGETFLSSEVTGLVVAQYVDLLSRVHSSGALAALTPRELDCIGLVGEGYGGREIAAQLNADEDAVAAMMKNLITKLQLASEQELAEYAGAQKWFRGQEDMESVLQRTLETAPKGPRPPRRQPLIDPLTNREMEVLELLAQRLYDKEIADRLSLAVTTVKTHVSHVLQKLSAGNRREAADKARELGIID